MSPGVVCASAILDVVNSSGANAPPTMTPRQAAALLAVSDGTVRRWLAEGRLPGVRVGGRLRVEPEALETFVRSAGPDNQETT